MAILDLITIGDIRLHHVDADPSAGGGLAADIGSLAMFDNGGAGELYLKTGAAATAWSLVREGLVDLTSEVTGVLPVANGGTGLNASTVTAGQLLIGNDTNNDFDLATLTAGSGISVVNADGSITISAVGGATSATVQTTDATVTTIATLDLSTADTVSYVEARFLAIVSGGTGGNDQKVCSFKRYFTAKNDGGVVTLEFTESARTFKDSALSAYDVDANASGTDLLLRVTGQANDNVEWKVEYILTSHA